MNNVFYVVWSDASVAGTFFLAHVNALWAVTLPFAAFAIIGGCFPRRMSWQAMIELVIGSAVAAIIVYYAIEGILLIAEQNNIHLCAICS